MWLVYPRTRWMPVLASMWREEERPIRTARSQRVADRIQGREPVYPHTRGKVLGPFPNVVRRSIRAREVGRRAVEHGTGRLRTVHPRTR